MTEYFALYANCIPVTGSKRSILCDLQRSTFHFIPNILAEKLLAERYFIVEQWMEEHNHEHDETISQYVSFLIDQEFGFITDEPELFPAMSTEWISPAYVTNAVIDRNGIPKITLSAIVTKLEAEGCIAIKINYSGRTTIDFIKTELRVFAESGIRSVTITFDKDYLSKKELTELFQLENRLHQIQVFNSINSTVEKISHKGIIRYSDRKQGIYYPKERYENFSISIPFFTESLHHHTFFNRKIFVDNKGEIRNLPSGESFGNIESSNLRELISDKKFSRYFNIKKNELPVCNKCEFRNICQDNRIPYQDFQGKWQFKNPCGYNPDLMKWNDESGYEIPSS